MKMDLIGALGGLVAGAGIALAQTPYSTKPAAVTPAVVAAPRPLGNLSLAEATTPAEAIAQPAADSRPCQDLGDSCACRERFWLTADYLFWWVKKGPQSDPLISTGPVSDAFPGALDQPGTSVVFGGQGINHHLFAGLRLDGGLWLDDHQRLGLEVGGLWLERRTTTFSAAGDANGQPFVARPFINALTGAENVYFVSQNLPDPSLTALMTGNITISSSTRFHGWETNAVANLGRSPCRTADIFAGFRALVLNEDLRFRENIANLATGGGASFLGTSIPPDDSNFITTYDNFVAHNRFYGPQIGGRIDWHSGNWSLGLVTKLAMGVSQELVQIDGASILVSGGVPVASAPGGIYAQTSNIGRYFRDQFAVVPEFGLNIGVQLSSHWQARLGYTFLYWSNVIRPGNALDRTINPNQVPTDLAFGTPGGPARPGFLFKTSDFWAQGINLGLEFRF